MNLRDALREGSAALEGAETPFLDASLILAHCLGWERSRLLASGPEEVSEEILRRYRGFIEERSRGLPVAYILGSKEFWGREFFVDRRVLIPRPDTETLVEAALRLGDQYAVKESGQGLRVHDVCTGSGCLAISLAAGRPAWKVTASDLSREALDVAAINAARLLPEASRLGLTEADLLAGLEGPFDLIVSNPPYVPSEETKALLARGWSEPSMALDGGLDGLVLIRRLIAEARTLLAPGGALLIEADGEQAGEIGELFAKAGFEDIHSYDDLGGIPRVSSGRVAWQS